MKEDMMNKLENVIEKNLDEIAKLNKSDPAKAAESLAKLTKSVGDYNKAEWSAFNDEEERTMNKETKEMEMELKSKELELKERELDIRLKQQEIDRDKMRKVSMDTVAKIAGTALLTGMAMLFESKGELLSRSVANTLPKMKIF